MSPVRLSRSSIISTTTSMNSTARMRIAKVLPRYQVRVRDGKKSSSTGERLLRAGLVRMRAVAPPQQGGQPLGELGVERLERADRLTAGHERDAEVHPGNQRGEQHE